MISGMEKPRYTKAQLAYFRECGAAGGRKGGKARLEKISPERRREIASLGGKAAKAKRVCSGMEP